MRDLLVTVLLVAGVALLLMACFGVVLMREPLDRVHYAGATTAATLVVAAAVVVRDSFSLIGNRAILIAAFVLVTTPVLTHVTARAIHRSREPR
jgi:multicomponent Na+:H+ antiporter subunit G